METRRWSRQTYKNQILVTIQTHFCRVWLTTDGFLRLVSHYACDITVPTESTPFLNDNLHFRLDFSLKSSDFSISLSPKVRIALQCPWGVPSSSRGTLATPHKQLYFEL